MTGDVPLEVTMWQRLARVRYVRNAKLCASSISSFTPLTVPVLFARMVTGTAPPAVSAMSSSPLGTHQQALEYFGRPGSAIDAHTMLPDEVMDAAHVVKGGWALSRLAPVLAKLDSADCCLHIMTIGGSVTCGEGDPTRDHMIAAIRAGWVPAESLNVSKTSREHELWASYASGRTLANSTLHGLYSFFRRIRSKLVSGINHTWANALVEYLNSRSSVCCPTGHRLSNLCAAGRGSAFFVDNFQSRVLPAFREHPADLVIVDTATNDLNAVANPRVYQRYISSLGGASLVTEALVRQLLLLSPTSPALLYTESAWFDPKRTPPSRVWGGWPYHKDVLQHYGIPTSFWTSALNLTSALMLKPHHRADESRREVIVDNLHLSRRGHEMCAYFLVSLMQAERKRIENLTAAERTRLMEHAGTLPPTHAQTLGGSRSHERLIELVEPALTLVDFTNNACWMNLNCSRTMRLAVPNLLGDAEEAPAAEPRWEWTMLRRSADGHYIETAWREAPKPAQAADKWGFMARTSGAAFVAHLNASRALRVGYLRSYDGDADVSVCMESNISDGNEVHLFSRTFTLRRRWEINASIYASTALRLIEEEGSFSGPRPGLWRVTFTLQPGATSSFTLYSLKSS
jgi:hypothetical protein